MGTNYYLRRKIELKDNCLPGDIMKLKNGYVWKKHWDSEENSFYQNLNVLQKDYYQDLHIGKSSCGWLFLLQGYPYEKEYQCFDEVRTSQSFNNIEDYIEEYNKSTTIGIFNEYGDRIALPEFLSIVKKEQAPSINRDKDGGSLPVDYRFSSYKNLLYLSEENILFFGQIPYRICYKGEFS